jgi:hypothetical protein
MKFEPVDRLGPPVIPEYQFIIPPPETFADSAITPGPQLVPGVVDIVLGEITETVTVDEVILPHAPPVMSAL